MKPVLSIGITSYKRVNELIRCINSIQTVYADDIEIIVSEDKSPLSKEIERAVKKISENDCKYKLRFSTNDKNLGYDMNLGEIIKKSHGKYVFFMSDDDAMCDGFLDVFIPFIKSNDGCGIIYSPFIYSENGKKDRFRGNRSFHINAGEKKAAKYIYDSILFSGLIFRKDYIENYDSSRFKNLNYFQVYLFLQMMLHYGGYYFATPSVLCIGDGENAYGLSESSGGNELLADRKSVKSNLEFNKTLIKVIRMFDIDEGTNVIESFAKQYSLHSYSGLSMARAEGKLYFKEYWKTFNQLDIPKYPITKAYYCLLSVLGKDNTDKLLSIFRKMVKKEN